MKNAIRISGLILASLTISTVAMAQAGGNGGGGAGGGASGGGDNSVIELRLRDHERARLTRARQEPQRGSSNCLTHVCNEPPPSRRPPAALVQLNESCGGGEYLVIRNRQGQVVRYVCETR